MRRPVVIMVMFSMEQREVTVRIQDEITHERMDATMPVAEAEKFLKIMAQGIKDVKESSFTIH